MQNLSLTMRNFNERVKQMNQTGSQQLVLSAAEARNLHADLFNLLAALADTHSDQSDNSVGQSSDIQLDGGGFIK
jgi:hypothetical protein